PLAAPTAHDAEGLFPPEAAQDHAGSSTAASGHSPLRSRRTVRAGAVIAAVLGDSAVSLGRAPAPGFGRTARPPFQGNGLRTRGAVAGAVHLAADKGRRLEAIGRTIRAIAGALLRHIAVTYRRAADNGRRLEAIGRTRRTAARAGLRHVARTRCRAAERAGRLEAVGRTGRTAARAGLRRVARTCCRPADGACRPEVVGRTVRPAARAGLGHVARTR